MPLSGLFSLFRRPVAAAPAAALESPATGIDYLRAQAGLGPPAVAEPEASPEPAPADVQPPDAQRPDSPPPEVQPADAAPPAEPLTCEMFIEQAQQAEKAEDWPAAEMIWRAIRTVIPQHWPSYVGGAAALRGLGRLDDARQLLDQGMATFPQERAFPLELGRLAMARSDWSAAEACWRKALAFDVRPWWVYTELAGALEHQGRLEDAEAVLREARIHADEPDEITLFINPARLAEKRGDWAAAVAHWAEVRRRSPSSIEFPDRHHEALMRLAEHDWAAYQAALRDSATTLRDENRALVLRFESLGGTGPDGGCEFGCLQRACDAEPLGLFRWAMVPAASLVAALRNRFAGIGEDGNISASPHDGQWEIRDTVYGTVMHSFLRVHEVPAEKVLARATRRMRYLKEKLIADLEKPEKIFVLKAGWNAVPAAAVEALGQAIRRYGPGELLCVCAADQDHAAGEITQAAPGVFIGYLDFSGTLDQAARRPEWLALCRKMLGMSATARCRQVETSP